MRENARFIGDGEWDAILRRDVRRAVKRAERRERLVYIGKLAAMLASGALFAWILYGWLR